MTTQNAYWTLNAEIDHNNRKDESYLLPKPTMRHNLWEFGQCLREGCIAEANGIARQISTDLSVKIKRMEYNAILEKYKR